MKQNIIHIGLDVDDTQYHGSAFNKDTGEVIVNRPYFTRHLSVIQNGNQRGAYEQQEIYPRVWQFKGQLNLATN